MEGRGGGGRIITGNEGDERFRVLQISCVCVFVCACVCVCFGLSLSRARGAHARARSLSLYLRVCVCYVYLRSALRMTWAYIDVLVCVRARACAWQVTRAGTQMEYARALVEFHDDVTTSDGIRV